MTQMKSSEENKKIYCQKCNEEIEGNPELETFEYNSREGIKIIYICFSCQLKYSGG